MSTSIQSIVVSRDGKDHILKPDSNGQASVTFTQDGESFQFNVSSIPEPVDDDAIRPRITSWHLIDLDTEDITKIQSGDRVGLKNFTVRAEAVNADSVFFLRSDGGVVRCKDMPFAAGGYKKGKYKPLPFNEDGEYTITATAYKGQDFYDTDRGSKDTLRIIVSR
jgi:hypothetical protein